jgi:hypothetical protein
MSVKEKKEFEKEKMQKKQEFFAARNKNKSGQQGRDGRNDRKGRN